MLPTSTVCLSGHVVADRVNEALAALNPPDGPRRPQAMNSSVRRPRNLPSAEDLDDLNKSRRGGAVESREVDKIAGEIRRGQ